MTPRQRHYTTWAAILVVIVGLVVLLEARDTAIRVRIEREQRRERCLEDQPCWDCTTMGNHRCGPIDR